jgi:hypothetical protein
MNTSVSILFYSLEIKKTPAKNRCLKKQLKKRKRSTHKKKKIFQLHFLLKNNNLKKHFHFLK